MQGSSGLLNVVTIPPGATPSQPRLVLDGIRGAIFVYGASGSGWSFTVSGTPLTDNYFIVATSQAANISLGNIFTVSTAPGIIFTVTSFDPPFAGFVNVHFTPSSPTPVNNPAVVTQQSALIGSWAGKAGTDPYGNAYPAGLDVASGSITGVVFNGVNFVLNSAGLFFYASTPALNNLICTISNVGGTDGPGNTYLPGITGYGGTANKWSAISIQQGGLINWYFMTTANMNGTWSAIQGQIVPGGSVSGVPTSLTCSGQGFLLSDQFKVQDSVNNIALIPSLVSLGSFAARGIFTLMADGGTNIPFLFTGDPTLGFPNTETWHDMRPLSNSFIGSISGQYPPQYRRTIEGFVEIYGHVQLPSTSANYNGVTFANLPAAYRPGTVPAHWPITMNQEPAATVLFTPRCEIDTSGNLQLHQMPSALSSTILCISGRFPLDQTGLILI